MRSRHVQIASAFLLGATGASARSYSIDNSCPPAVRDSVMTEALNMAQLAVNRRNDEEMSTFLGLIYPGINDNQKGTLFGQ